MASKDWELISESANGWNHQWAHKKNNISVESVKYSEDLWQFEVMKNARAIERKKVKTKKQSMLLAREYMRSH